MADQPWSFWLDAVLSDMPGCSIAVATFEIKRGAIDFFDRSCAWRKALTAVDSVTNSGDYLLPDPAANQSVARLLEVRWQGAWLTPKTPEELAEFYRPTDWRTVNGPTPNYFTQEYPNRVRIVPAPTAVVVGGINGLWAAVKPKDDALGVEAAIASEYFNEVRDAAKRNLFSSPKKPYTNPALAAAYSQRLDEAIGDAAFRAFKGSAGRARTRTHFR